MFIFLPFLPPLNHHASNFFFLYSRKYLPFDTKPCTILVRIPALIFWESQPAAYSPAIMTRMVFLTFSLKRCNATLK